MRAILSGNDGAIIQDLQQPSPGPDQILVRVKAGALNRADLMILRGAVHGGWGAGFPLGLEFAGDVVETGPGVDAWRVGDRVMGAGPGAFAEYTVAHERQLYAIPEGMPFEQAATLPVSLQTMHDAICTNGMIAPAQTVFIQGASSGMGLMGMQVAKFMGAGLVIGSSTSPEKRARLPEFGADVVVDAGADDWLARVLDATGRQGVDLLIDFLAGPYINGNLEATRVGGRMINIGRMAGESGEFSFDLHNMRRITFIGASFRMRSPQETMEVIAKAVQALTPALAKGVLRMPIDTIYRFEEASRALERMAKNKHFGKIVLSIP